MNVEGRAVFEQVELYLVCQRLKVVIKDEIARFGVNPDTLNVDMAINSTAIRNALIRNEFKSSRRLGIKAEVLYCNLSIKHNLSFDHIMNIVKFKE